MMGRRRKKTRNKPGLEESELWVAKAYGLAAVDRAMTISERKANNNKKASSVCILDALSQVSDSFIDGAYVGASA